MAHGKYGQDWVVRTTWGRHGLKVSISGDFEGPDHYGGTTVQFWGAQEFAEFIQALAKSKQALTHFVADGDWDEDDDRIVRLRDPKTVTWVRGRD